MIMPTDRIVMGPIEIRYMDGAPWLSEVPGHPDLGQYRGRTPDEALGGMLLYNRERISLTVDAAPDAADSPGASNPGILPAGMTDRTLRGLMHRWTAYHAHLTGEAFKTDDDAETIEDIRVEIIRQLQLRAPAPQPVYRDTGKLWPGPSGLLFHEQDGGYEILAPDGRVIAAYKKLGHAGHHFNTGHATRPNCCERVDARGDVKHNPSGPM